MAVNKSKATTKPTRSEKGTIARNKLKKAAFKVLERSGYHKMRIADVTGEAGVAAGLFYHYFSDLKSLTIEVLSDFIAESKNIEVIEKNVPKGDWYERILAHNRLSVSAYAKHPGIMRCLLQMADEDSKFAEILRDNFRQQLSWLVALMPKLFPKAAFSEHQARMIVYTLAGTGEAMLKNYYINKEPELLTEPVNVEEMAELLSVIYYRGLFLENPPLDKLSYTANLQYMKR